MNSKNLVCAFAGFIILSSCLIGFSCTTGHASPSHPFVAPDDGVLVNITVYAYQLDWNDDGNYDGVSLGAFFHNASDGFVKITGDVSVRIYGPTGAPVCNKTVRVDYQSSIDLNIPYSAFFTSKGNYRCVVSFGGVSGFDFAYADANNARVPNLGHDVGNDDFLAFVSVILLAAFILASILGIVISLRRTGSAYRTNHLLPAMYIIGICLFAIVYIPSYRSVLWFTKPAYDLFSFECTWVKLIIPLVSGIFIGLDARSINAGRLGGKENMSNPASWGPASWAAIVMLFGFILSFIGILLFLGFILWAVFVFLYMVMRCGIHQINNPTPAYGVYPAQMPNAIKPTGDPCPNCGSELKGPLKYCKQCDRTYGG